MSLIHEFMTECVLLDKAKVPDGEGGWETKWTESEPFTAALTKSTSIEAKRAEKEGVTALYSVVTDKTFVLNYHDVFRRVSDGKIFRVTEDGTDQATPDSSTLNIRKVSAEEWSLT